MNSRDILQVIKQKHSEDIVVPECRTGPSQGRYDEYVIMDCWTVPHSWAHYQATAYEIKVSRQDFVRDTKWQKYLPYCNYMYFVAPKGIIQLAELPAEIGLYEVSSNCKRLLIKRKAAYRTVDIPVELYKYLLICRTAIRSDRTIATSRQAYWTEWLKEREISRDLGHHVSKQLRQTIEDRIRKVQDENTALKKQNASLEYVRKQITDMGLNPEEHYVWNLRERVRERLEEYKVGLPGELDNVIERMERVIRDLKECVCLKKDNASGTSCQAAKN